MRPCGMHFLGCLNRHALGGYCYSCPAGSFTDKQHGLGGSGALGKSGPWRVSLHVPCQCSGAPLLLVESESEAMPEQQAVTAIAMDSGSDIGSVKITAT